MIKHLILLKMQSMMDIKGVFMGKSLLLRVHISDKHNET